MRKTNQELQELADIVADAFFSAKSENEAAHDAQACYDSLCMNLDSTDCVRLSLLVAEQVG